jgi:hypothetical protein
MKAEKEALVEHLVGYIIIGLIIVSLVLTWFLVNRQWKEKEPHEYYRDVGIRYMPGVLRPWHGMNEAIDAIYDILEKNPEYLKARGVPFWIHCYPYSGDLITSRSTTGFIYSDTGMPAPKPKTEEEAAKVAMVAGTGDKLKKWPWSRSIPVILIKEMRKGDSKIDGRLARGTGPRLGVGWTALHHEHAQHFVSELVYGDENLKHERKDLKQLTEKYRVVYNARVPEEKA